MDIQDDVGYTIIREKKVVAFVVNKMVESCLRWPGHVWTYKRISKECIPDGGYR